MTLDVDLDDVMSELAEMHGEYASVSLPTAKALAAEVHRLRAAVAAERERCAVVCEATAGEAQAAYDAVTPIDGTGEDEERFEAWTSYGAQVAQGHALAARIRGGAPAQAEQRAPLTAEQHLQGALDHLRATYPQTPENVVDLCPPKPCLECGRPCTTIYCGVRCVRVGMPAQAEQRVSETQAALHHMDGVFAERHRIAARLRARADEEEREMGRLLAAYCDNSASTRSYASAVLRSEADALEHGKP